MDIESRIAQRIKECEQQQQTHLELVKTHEKAAYALGGAIRALKELLAEYRASISKKKAKKKTKKK